MKRLLQQISGGMRNISAGAVIAVAYFPAAIVLPVIVGMLFQQALASIYAAFIEKKIHGSAKNTKNVSA